MYHISLSHCCLHAVILKAVLLVQQATFVALCKYSAWINTGQPVTMAAEAREASDTDALWIRSWPVGTVLKSNKRKQINTNTALEIFYVTHH